MPAKKPGYTDTPMLPNAEYRVHDAERPRPPDISPGECTLPATPPSDATVLLNGSTLEGWETIEGEEAGWNATGDAVEVEPETGDIRTTDRLGDCQLHIEWATPEAAAGEGQERGNSGVFMMDRYEIQVLDNFENPTYADGYAGAVYGQHPPLVNASRPPGAWQSYDIVWHAPRFENGTVTAPARLTLFHNGVLVQDGTELIGETTHADIVGYEPHPESAPLRLQDHGDRVRYRNIWYRSL
jgi:hypothetical protein